MAKLKTPLLSFEARGKLAKTLVFMGWKGIKDVRQYVIPANPRTDAQVAQRARLTNAIKKYHEIPWDGDFQIGASVYKCNDTKAIRRTATLQPRPMSGFNWLVMEAIRQQIAQEELHLLSNHTLMVASDTESGPVCSFDFQPTPAYMRCYYGTNPRVLLDYKTAKVIAPPDSGGQGYVITDMNTIPTIKGIIYYARWTLWDAAKDIPQIYGPIIKWIGGQGNRTPPI